MRIDVKKFLFVGLEEDRRRFFEKAQDMGFVQFIDFKEAHVREIPDELEKINSAIKVLRSFHPTEQEEIDDYTLSDEISSNILNLNEHLEYLFEQQRMTKHEISRIQMFGDFSINDIEIIEKEGHRKIQFFTSKHALMDEKPLPKELFYVATDKELDYFFSIRKEASQYEGMTEMIIKQPLGSLNHRMGLIELQIHETDEKLKHYAKYNSFLHQAFIKKLNKYHLYSNQEYSQPAMNSSLFSVEGWIPIDQLNNLVKLMENLKIHYEEIAISSRDIVPTYLKKQRDKSIR